MDPYTFVPPLSPRTTTYLKLAQVTQVRTFHLHVLDIYNREAHTKYIRWSEESIAWDIAEHCFIDGIFTDPFSDMEDHALEVCAFFARIGIWRESEKMRGLLSRWRKGGGGAIGHGEWTRFDCESRDHSERIKSECAHNNVEQKRC